MNTPEKMTRRSNKLSVAILLLFNDYIKADSETWDPTMYVEDSNVGDGTNYQFLYGPNIEASTELNDIVECIASDSGFYLKRVT